MKALVSLVLAVGIIGGVYLATTSGCGARAQVAGDKILDMIDSLSLIHISEPTRPY